MDSMMDSKIHPKVATNPLLAGQDSYSENSKTFWKNFDTAISAEISRCMSKCTQTLCKNMVKDTVNVANS